MKIKIYSIPTCSKCKEVKKYLNDRNIVYEDINLVDKDRRDERAYYRSMKIDILPVIISDDKVFVGWDVDIEKRLNELLR